MVDIQLIRRLRDETGHSITKCKEALEESDGDLDAARDHLREKGSLAAQKKSDRELGSGVIRSYIHNTNQIGALVELLCETDFVARNEEFITLAENIAMHAAAFQPQYVSRSLIPEEVLAPLREELQSDIDTGKPKEVQENILAGKLDAKLKEVTLLDQSFVLDDKRTVQNVIEEAVQKFGERISVNRFAVWVI